jgi:hypothetical protein
LSLAVCGAFIDPEDEDVLPVPFVPPLLEEPPEPKSPPELPEACSPGVCASTGVRAPVAKVAIIAAVIPYALKLITCS